MEISFSKLIIPTMDRSLFFRFMTSIFDTEIQTDITGEIFTIVGGVKIYTKEVLKKTRASKPLFIFELQNIIELENLKNKIDFFLYREGLKLKKNIIEKGSLVFCDFDWNIWQIDACRSLPVQNTQEQHPLM